MDIIKETMGKIQLYIERIRLILEKNREKTVCVFTEGMLHGVEGKGGSVRHAVSVEASTRKEGYARLGSAGLSAKEIVLVLNSPSLRTEIRTYPDMTAHELAETIEWEREDAKAMVYRVLSHDATGYTILVCLCPKSLLAAHVQESAAVGKKIVRFVIPTDIFDSEGITVFGGKKEATIFFRNGNDRRWRHFRRNDAAGQWNVFFDSLPVGGIWERRFIPLSDCDERDGDFWKTLVECENSALQEDGLRCLRNSLSGNVLAFSIDESGTFAVRGRGRIWCCGILAAWLVGQGIYGGFLAWDRHQAEDEAFRLSSVRADRAVWRQEREEARFLREKIRSLDEWDGHWQAKLIDIASFVPEGMTLSEIQAEGQTVRIHGEALQGRYIYVFCAALESRWGGTCRVERQQSGREEQLFVLAWDKGGRL